MKEHIAALLAAHDKLRNASALLDGKCSIPKSSMERRCGLIDGAAFRVQIMLLRGILASVVPG
jgi:hypothetical protein